MIEDWIQNPRGSKGGVDLWFVRETGWRNRVRATTKEERRSGLSSFRLGIEAGPPDLELLAACAACAACCLLDRREASGHFRFQLQKLDERSNSHTTGASVSQHV